MSRLAATAAARAGRLELGLERFPPPHLAVEEEHRQVDPEAGHAPAGREQAQAGPHRGPLAALGSEVGGKDREQHEQAQTHHGDAVTPAQEDAVDRHFVEARVDGMSEDPAQHLPPGAADRLAPGAQESPEIGPARHRAPLAAAFPGETGTRCDGVEHGLEFAGQAARQERQQDPLRRRLDRHQLRPSPELHETEAHDAGDLKRLGAGVPDVAHGVARQLEPGPAPQAKGHRRRRQAGENDGRYPEVRHEIEVGVAARQKPHARRQQEHEGRVEPAQHHHVVAAGDLGADHRRRAGHRPKIPHGRKGLRAPG
ncbi:MAG TPA: hypothetical protein VGC93_06685 [Thermoanaerobaculia bacterium]